MTPSFMDSVRAGTAKLCDVDNWVERWHNGEGENMPLRDFLGLTPREYQDFALRAVLPTAQGLTQSAQDLRASCTKTSCAGTCAGNKPVV